jgi:hypothetical protein
MCMHARVHTLAYQYENKCQSLCLYSKCTEMTNSHPVESTAAQFASAWLVRHQVRHESLSICL